jgi:uncharacterized protein YjiS (DUF1127 family)
MHDMRRLPEVRQQRPMPRVRIWITRVKTRQRLRELDLRQLADVGLSEAERQRECMKWFWQR